MAAISSAGRATGLEPLQLAAGSHAAAALYERHSSSVFGYCLSRLGRREDAEDAVQTTFLHAVRGLRRGVVPATEIAWLLGIARNVCLARWESVGRRSRLESPCDPVELDRGHAAPQGGREELIGLEDALSQLPDQQRRAVLLRDWRGLSYEEIATQLNVSHAAVETLIFRGRRTLAELLRDEPQATRRRLRSLGDLGSFFSAVKTALTGGAAATKVVLAAVTAVALSGTGAVIGTSIHGGGSVPVHAPDTEPARAGSLAPVAPERRLEVRSPTLPPPATRQLPATRSAPAFASTPTAAQPATAPVATTLPGETATPTPTSSNPHGAPHPNPSQPEPIVAVSPAEELLPALTGAVEETVDTLPQNLPVEVPTLPLPPVAVPLAPLQLPNLPTLVEEPLATVTVPPVEISPPKLLP